MTDSGACNKEAGMEIVKEGFVSCGGKRMKLLLNTSGLTLKDEASSGAKKKKDLDLPWSEVIAAQPSKKFKGDDEKKGFCLHYMELQSNKKLQSKRLDILSCEDPGDVWIEIIQRQCASVENRPKRLFVVINPIGGSESGAQVYEKKVRPIFELAQIHADVHLTERAKHSLEMGENQDFSSYDGIIVLGGDGTYHEILQGLTIQTQNAAGVEYNDKNTKLKPLSKPIGVIPTGTGNGVSGWFNGTIDVETATLRVVKGDRHRATIFSVYNDGKLLAICGLLIGYGFFSDMIKRTDELRWMKRARYPYCILATIFSKPRGWQCDLEYQLKPDSQAGENSSAGQESEQGAECKSNDHQWIKHDSKGRMFTGVSTFIANIEKKGEKTYVDTSADHVSLLVDHGCSTISLMKFIFKFMYGKEVEPLPTNLELVRKVQGFRLKVIKDPSESAESLSGAKAKARELEQLLDIDGEVKKMDVLDFEMRVIPEFVPVYGIYRPEL